MKEMLYLLKRRIRHLIKMIKPVPQCFYDFYKFNSPWWKENTPETKNAGSILYVSRTPFPLAMVVNMPVVKKIAEEQHKKIVIGLPYAYNDKQTKLLYGSYGVDDYMIIDTSPWYMWLYFAYKALKIIYTKNGVEKLLKLSYKGVSFGEELYDAIIRMDTNMYTIDKMSIKYISIIVDAYSNIYNADKAFSNKYDTLVYGDCDYNMQGWPKMAIHHNRKCFQANCSGIIDHQEKKENRVFNGGRITKEIYESESKKIDARKLEEFLRKRFVGADKNYLDCCAYYNKKEYSLATMYDVLCVNHRERKNVLIAAHAFSDAPHYAYNMIFKDYFTWLFETIKILKESDNVNVFVKEHPTAYYYGEKGSVAYYVAKYQMDNVYVLPQDFNTISVFSTMDAVVTCQGTIGLEATIYGIPVFTAGQGYYYGFGIDNNSDNLEEYIYKMHHITEYPKPTEHQIRLAKEVLYLSMKRDEIRPSIIEIQDQSVKMNWLRPDAIIAQCCSINELLKEGITPKENYDNLLKYIKVMHD